MLPRMRDERQIETTASKRFTRYYLLAFGVAALIGLLIGTVWVIAGILHFHPFW
jgi:hypothetical protein